MDSGGRTGACAFLIAEQERVLDCFRRFERAEGVRSRISARDEALDAVEVVLALEEQLFCPAVRDALGARRGTAGILAAGRSARLLVRELRASSGRGAGDARFALLKELLSRHFEDERAGLFSRVAGSDLDLDRLGGEMAEFKDRLAGARPRGASRRLLAAFASILP